MIDEPVKSFIVGIGEEKMKAGVQPVHDLFHQDLHLLVVEARKLRPGNLTVWGDDLDVRKITDLGIWSLPGVQIFEGAIANRSHRDCQGKVLEALFRTFG